jgi:hypothetical protein
LLELQFKDQGVLTMAPTKITRKAAAIGLAFAASAFIAAPATAQEGGLTRSILGIVGITAPDRPVIEYRERAPLVVPPSRDLPPPVAPDALAANPQWPDDPSARAERMSNLPPAIRNDSIPLSIDEMRAGRRAGSRGSGPSYVNDYEMARPLTPIEMQNTHRRDTDTQGLTRRFLTDPPNAFLQPAPSN